MEFKLSSTSVLSEGPKLDHGLVLILFLLVLTRPWAGPNTLSLSMH